jgi:sulfoxide reductase heme-binding subunit YedZ
MSRKSRVLAKVVVWALCLLPLSLLVSRAATGDLGANPIDFITDWLGDWALRLLLATLALTPIRILTGAPWPLVFRRLLGLFAFAYAALHFSVWILVDHFFNWEQMLADLVKRRYITVGMLALALLVPLAVTSTSGMIRRLGGAAWRRLHRLVYLTAILAVLHYLWLAKPGVQAPFYYAAVLVLLLGVRAADWARRAWRRRLRAPKPVQPAASPAPR